MKNMLLLAVLVGLFAVVSTNVQAQQGIKNATNCAMLVKFAHGNPFTCTTTGTQTYTLAPMSSIFPLPIPAGEQIVVAKGADVGFTCPIWYIGFPCSGYSFGQGIVCPTCNDYKAELIPYGIYLHY
ncbi:MAG: hypothetical protein ACFB10_05070 [Salibacteraceae bacterium]